jgi:hypothetical protein
LSPEEGAALRDALRSQAEPAAQRLAEVMDSTISAILASPLHAGTRRLKVTADERGALLEALEAVETSALDRFAKLRREVIADM